MVADDCKDEDEMPSLDLRVEDSGEVDSVGSRHQFGGLRNFAVMGCDGNCVVWSSTS